MTARASTHRARALRREITEAEAPFWAHVRAHRFQGAKFKRQVPFSGYFADFACIDAGLIVEIDGGQHDTNRIADAARSKNLEAAGFRVLRFWNNEVLNNIAWCVGHDRQRITEKP